MTGCFVQDPYSILPLYGRIAKIDDDDIGEFILTKRISFSASYFLR
jgi:hypothetical protein